MAGAGWVHQPSKGHLGGTPTAYAAAMFTKALKTPFWSSHNGPHTRRAGGSWSESEKRMNLEREENSEMSRGEKLHSLRERKKRKEKREGV